MVLSIWGPCHGPSLLIPQISIFVFRSRHHVHSTEVRPLCKSGFTNLALSIRPSHAPMSLAMICIGETACMPRTHHLPPARHASNICRFERKAILLTLFNPEPPVIYIMGSEKSNDMIHRRSSLVLAKIKVVLQIQCSLLSFQLKT